MARNIVKTPDEIVGAIDKRLADTWQTSILAELGINPLGDGGTVADDGEGNAAIPESVSTPPWPRLFPLGRTTSAQIAADFGQLVAALQRWRDWASEWRVQLHEEIRLIGGTRQHVPSHIGIPDLDTAAAIAAGKWPDQVAVARTRTAELLRRFPAMATDTAFTRTLRTVVDLSDLDFDILCRVAHWFRDQPRGAAHGLTPRQVPLDGVHAKWLNTNQTLVRTLAGLDNLGLLPGHPPRVHFTYLDPAHLAAGGRRHDSYSVGDRVELPYQPTVIVISENKDTAIGFPPVPGAISVEGGGTGGGTISAVPWIRNAPLVIYWGDMDVAGLGILNEFRSSGVPASSILMDTATYRAYERYGTNHDPKGRPLKVARRTPMCHLRDGELDLYEYLISGAAPVLRIEQERVPLDVAKSELHSLLETWQLRASPSDPLHGTV